MSQLVKGQRITGADRLKLGKDLKKQYKAGASIRELAAQTSRSYGFVHRVLSDEGVQLRGRGGATRTRAGGSGSRGAAKPGKAAKAAKNGTVTATKKKRNK